VSQNRAIDHYLQGNANYNRTNFGIAVTGLTKTRSRVDKNTQNHDVPEIGQTLIRMPQATPVTRSHTPAQGHSDIEFWNWINAKHASKNTR